MKNVLTVLLLVIVLTLSGCGTTTQNLKEDNYVTYEELDEKLKNYMSANQFETYNSTLDDSLDLAFKQYYTKEKIDILLDEIMDYYDSKIEELKQDNAIVYSNCDIDELIGHVFQEFVKITSGDFSYNYTFQFDENGDLLEFYQGNYRETITYEDMYENYCEIESEE